MSWTIHNIINTIKVTDKCSKELNKWYCENVAYDTWDNDTPYLSAEGVIWFHEDDMEFMDSIEQYSEIKEILCKHKARGMVGFADFEGDNKGKIWGYCFDGKGKMHNLTGKVVWS